MSHYSALEVLRGGLTGQKHWKPAWRDPEPKREYDAILIGGGGHGAGGVCSRHHGRDPHPG